MLLHLVESSYLVVMREVTKCLRLNLLIQVAICFVEGILLIVIIIQELLLQQLQVLFSRLSTSLGDDLICLFCEVEQFLGLLGVITECVWTNTEHATVVAQKWRYLEVFHRLGLSEILLLGLQDGSLLLH